MLLDSYYLSQVLVIIITNGWRLLRWWLKVVDLTAQHSVLDVKSLRLVTTLWIARQNSVSTENKLAFMALVTSQWLINFRWHGTQSVTMILMHSFPPLDVKSQNYFILTPWIHFFSNLVYTWSTTDNTTILIFIFIISSLCTYVGVTTRTDSHMCQILCCLWLINWLHPVYYYRPTVMWKLISKHISSVLSIN